MRGRCPRVGLWDQCRTPLLPLLAWPKQWRWRCGPDLDSLSQARAAPGGRQIHTWAWSRQTDRKPWPLLPWYRRHHCRRPPWLQNASPGLRRISGTWSRGHLQRGLLRHRQPHHGFLGWYFCHRLDPLARGESSAFLRILPWQPWIPSVLP